MQRDDEIADWMMLSDFEYAPHHHEKIEKNERGFQLFAIIDHAQYERGDSGSQLFHLVAHSDHSQSQS
jgi:hypothetical protein